MSRAADISETTKRRPAHARSAGYLAKYLRLKLAARLWALWVPVLARGKDLEPLLARTSPGHRTPYSGLSADSIGRCIRKAVRRPFFMADRKCLREGLLLNRFLVMAGFAPTLHFGIDRTSLSKARPEAHCWVTLGDMVFNPPGADITEIWSYGHGGASPDAKAPR